jgi:hypothetical protein
MNISIHHYNDGQAHTYFGRGHHHDKEYKDLPVEARIGIGSVSCQVVNLRKSDQEQVNRVQHKFNAHKDDDGIATDQHAATLMQNRAIARTI